MHTNHAARLLRCARNDETEIELRNIHAPFEPFLPQNPHG
jgi:hypothetical protein